MGRQKIKPEKSLYSVDYNNPSVAQWFFGQSLPNAKNLSNPATVSSIPRDKNKFQRNTKPANVSSTISNNGQQKV